MTQLRSYVVLLALVACAVLTFWGLYQMSMIEDSPSWGMLNRPVVLLIVAILVVEPLSRLMNISRLFAGATCAVLIAIFTGTVWPLLVTIWFLLACYVVGYSMLTAFGIDKRSHSTIAMILTGAGIYGTAVGLSAHFPVNYPAVYGFALAIPVALGWRSITENIFIFNKFSRQSTDHSWLDLAIVVVALAHFCVGLMPEVGHDALAMHLFIPGHLAYRHEWAFDAGTYVWAVMPMMGDWLFAIGYMLAGETAARLINVGFIFIIGWLIRDVVLWAGGNARGAKWAVLLFLTTPLTYTESSSLFIESIWTAFVLAGALSVLKVISSDGSQEAHIPVAGILLGSALAAKAVTFTILPVLLLLLIIRYRLWLKAQLVRPLVLGLVFFVSVGAIPYVVALSLTGNPVFPFYNQIFQSEYYPAVNFDVSSVFGKGVNWDTLYQVTFHTEKFMEGRAGAAGFQWLLLLIPATFALIFSGQRRGVILIALSVLSVVLAFQSVAYLRYVFPSFAWLVAAIGVAFSAVATNPDFIRRALLLAGLLVVVLNLMFFKSGTYYGDLSLQALMSSTGRDDYLNSRLPIRNAVKLVNRVNTGRTPVAVFAAPLIAGLEADGLYSNWYNHQFQAKVNKAQDANEIARLLLDYGADYVILDSNWGEADKRKLVEAATQELDALGSISIRKLKGEYQFQTELLSDADFTATTAWTLPSGAIDQSPGSVIVSVAAPAFQVVPVSGGRRYMNSVSAVCAGEPGQGRLQVNWLDARSEFISTDIQVFDCSHSESTHTMLVVAPRDAVFAVVYASGHTEVPVIFRNVSFKL